MEEFVNYEGVFFEGWVYCVEHLPVDILGSDERIRPIFIGLKYENVWDCKKCGKLFDCTQMWHK